MNQFKREALEGKVMAAWGKNKETANTVTLRSIADIFIANGLSSLSLEKLTAIATILLNVGKDEKVTFRAFGSTLYTPEIYTETRIKAYWKNKRDTIELKDLKQILEILIPSGMQPLSVENINGALALISNVRSRLISLESGEPAANQKPLNEAVN